jgi:predicted PurR-regulated permease PerM
VREITDRYNLTDYLIAPHVMRNTVDLSAVAALLAALIGGAVLGLVGTIMAIPIAAAVKVVTSQTSAKTHEPYTKDFPRSARVVEDQDRGLGPGTRATG